MSSKPTPDLKQNTVLAFDDGLLTIKQSGHGEANGWGELAFHERQVEIDADGFHKVEIPPSELRELRDFLSRTLPADETGLTPQQLRERLEKAIAALNSAQDQIVRDGDVIKEDEADKSHRQTTLDAITAAIASVEAAS